MVLLRPASSERRAALIVLFCFLPIELREKPDLFSGTPESHSENLNEFIQKLDLQNITLVVHDFGGPIGLAAGIKNSDRIRNVILFNSWLWETKDDKDAQNIDKTINSFIGKFLYLNLNFSPRFLLKKGFSDKRKLSDKIHKHYIKPFPDKNSRSSLLNLAKSLVGSSDWYQNQWNQLDSLISKDWLILWGNKDSFIKTDSLEKWEKRIPNAVVKTFNCGHFVQEEKTKESIEQIWQFLK